MKIAIVYNRESQRVINLFGVPNQEKYGQKNIQRIMDALKAGGHQVQAFEGDKDLIDKLEEFMPRVVKGERPGLVFNLSYGIQGQARYTHVPGMLEMIGLPYVGSGPLAHSLALDKVVSKMIFLQHGLPTPEFAVLPDADAPLPKLKYPLIVKPKNESVSFGIKICHNEEELREGAGRIFKEFAQPVLVERYIDGREINVGLIGNRPTEVLPPAEIVFGETGPKIYTYEDKTRKSGREVKVICPAKLTPEQTKRAQEIARGAYEALGCFDCSRVDMRLDDEGNFYILEINSLPSLGEHGSYVEGAARAGLDFVGLVNRLVEVASQRYFGTPKPPDLTPSTEGDSERVFNFMVARRDDLERSVQQWARLRSRTADPLGLQAAVRDLDEEMRGLGLKATNGLTEGEQAHLWQTKNGFEGGTLLIGHLDVPTEPGVWVPTFRREAEWILGEGVGSSRAPLCAMLFALKALKQVKKLKDMKLGVLYYTDEGHECRYSTEVIRKIASEAGQILVMRPGNVGDKFVTGRRGQRIYRLTAEGTALRPGKISSKPEVLRWAFDKLDKCAQLSHRQERITVSTINMSTQHLPMLLPHALTAVILVSYPDEDAAKELENKIRSILDPDGPIDWKLERISARPPMKETRANTRLAKALKATAKKWEIPLEGEASVWPSVAGLAPASAGAVCGLGPIARDLYMPHEAVNRVSLTQRSLLLAEFLLEQAEQSKPS